MAYNDRRKLSFSWDERKNISNFRKHGIWFEEAKTVWADAYAVELFDEPHSQDEERFLRIGRSSKQRTLLIVFCEKDDDAIRIVSARAATAHERKQYEEGI